MGKQDDADQNVAGEETPEQKQDLNDASVVGNMTDEELEKAGRGSDEPPKGPDRPETKDEKSEEQPGGEDTPEATPQKADEQPPKAEETAPTAGGPQDLILGKYKTEDDLRNAAKELNKHLYGETVGAKATDKLIAGMQGDELQDFYKSMEAEQGARGSDSEPSPTESREEAPLVDTEEAQKAFEAAISQETFRQFQMEPLYQEMQRDGIPMPKNQEEWEALKSSYPYVAIKIEQKMDEIHGDLLRAAAGYKQAVLDEPKHRDSEIQSSRNKISEFATTMGYKVEEADMNKFIEDATKDPAVFEEHNGVPYIREGAIFERYLAKEFPKLAPRLKEIQKAEGRAQGVDDIERAQKEAARTVSTSGPVTGARAARGKVDYNDQDTLNNMSDEEIDRKVAEARRG